MWKDYLIKKGFEVKYQLIISINNKNHL